MTDEDEPYVCDDCREKAFATVCPDCLEEAWAEIYWDAVEGFLYDENDTDAFLIDLALDVLVRDHGWAIAAPVPEPDEEEDSEPRLPSPPRADS